MGDLVHRQRQGLCTMLADLDHDQWSAETLCSGWDAGDVAAHLVVRERELWAAPGILFGGPFASVTQRRYAAWKARGPQRLIAALRAGPPWPLSGPLGDSQAVEDWIHEQDVRRGGAKLPTIDPDPELSRALWTALKRFAARALVIKTQAVIELTDGTRSHRLQTSARGPLARTTTAEPDVTISGRVGELLLYVTGRPGEVASTGNEHTRELLLAHDRAL